MTAGTTQSNKTVLNEAKDNKMLLELPYEKKNGMNHFAILIKSLH